ncbi:MAG: hypothetical protein J5634_03160 [Bacilli bacterium]|nr:hypothetical protein [Bacilli bacterium]
MKAIMTLITNYYWIFIILAIFLLISCLGIYVEGRKNKADEIGEKLDDKMIEEAEKKAEEERNKR